MDPGEGAWQQSEGASKEADYTMARHPVLNAVLGEEASCALEASPTGSGTSRPAGHHVERTGLVPGVERVSSGL